MIDHDYVRALNPEWPLAAAQAQMTPWPLGGSTDHPDVYGSAEAQHLDTSMALSDSPGS